MEARKESGSHRRENRALRASAEWEQRLVELLEFKLAHGHAKVPRGWPQDRSWPTGSQTSDGWCGRGFARGPVPAPAGMRVHWEGQKERLLAQEQTWQRMLGALRTFQRTFGHLDVPRGWHVEPRLPGWMATQRLLRRRGKLHQDRLSRLDELGFKWTQLRNGSAPVRPQPPGGRSGAWDRMFVALQEYRRTYGNCNVPAAGRPIGDWPPGWRISARSKGAAILLRNDSVSWSSRDSSGGAVGSAGSTTTGPGIGCTTSCRNTIASTAGATSHQARARSAWSSGPAGAASAAGPARSSLGAAAAGGFASSFFSCAERYFGMR